MAALVLPPTLVSLSLYTFFCILTNQIVESGLNLKVKERSDWLHYLICGIGQRWPINALAHVLVLHPAIVAVDLIGIGGRIRHVLLVLIADAV